MSIIKSQPVTSLQRRAITKNDDGTISKSGIAFRVQREADALKYVYQQTSLPVPKVLSVHIGKDGYGSLMMECMEGKTLDYTTWKGMDGAAQSITVSDLQRYISELRSLQQPQVPFISSCTGGPAYDHRFHTLTECGPFGSEAEFNSYLLSFVRRCPSPSIIAKYETALSKSPSHKSVFTHADLHSENILLNTDTGKITAIIDWEMAGWWPEYWEYRKARYSSDLWWTTLVEKIMKPYLEEFQLDQELADF